MAPPFFVILVDNGMDAQGGVPLEWIPDSRIRANVSSLWDTPVGHKVRDRLFAAFLELAILIFLPPQLSRRRSVHRINEDPPECQQERTAWSQHMLSFILHTRRIHTTALDPERLRCVRASEELRDRRTCAPLLTPPPLQRLSAPSTAIGGRVARAITAQQSSLQGCLVRWTFAKMLESLTTLYYASSTTVSGGNVAALMYCTGLWAPNGVSRALQCRQRVIHIRAGGAVKPGISKEGFDATAVRQQIPWVTASISPGCRHTTRQYMVCVSSVLLSMNSYITR